MKKIVFTLCLAALAAVAAAQDLPKNIFGIRAGLSVSTLRVDEDETGVEPGGLTSFHLGASWQHLITPSMPFYFETGLYLSQKGCKATGRMWFAEYDLDIKAMYLEVPALAVYRFELPLGFAVQPFAGLYFGYGIGGKAKFSSGSYSSEASLFKDGNIRDSDGDPQPSPQLLKRGDVGLRFGAGATWERYYLGLGYELGLTDNVKEDEYGVGFARNRTFTFTLGYNF